METSALSLYSSYATNRTTAVSSSESGAKSSTSSDSQNSGQDSVTISEAAKTLSKIIAKGRGEATPDDTESQDPIERIKKKIEELEKKIAQVEQSSVPDSTKQGVVKGMETELASLRQQLAQLMAESTQSASGSGSGSGSAKA